MKFKTRKSHFGQKRKKVKFLWWPRSYGGEYVYWLCWKHISEEVKQVSCAGGAWNNHTYGWVETGFVD